MLTCTGSPGVPVPDNVAGRAATNQIPFAITVPVGDGWTDSLITLD
jgi:hypothetical protein